MTRSAETGAETPAASPTPAEAALAAARAQVEGQVRRARRALALERFVAAAWPAWTVLAAFVGLALSGAFEAAPRLLHIALLCGFALAGVAALAHAARRFRLPSTAEAREALDLDQADRPLAALDDAQAIGAADPASRAVWEAHQRRMAERAAALRARAADLRLSRRDPLALRLAALILLLAGALIAGGQDGAGRVAAAFNPGAGGEAAEATPPSVEAWATPPAYTGARTIYLTERIGETVALPEGARLSLRVYNAPEAPLLAQDVAEAEVAPAPYGEGAWDVQLDAARSGALSLTLQGETLAEWRFAVAEDAAPRIAFAGPPGAEIAEAEGGQGALRIAFTAADDHGVAAAWAVIALDRAALSDRADLAPPPPGLEPIELELPLPFTGAATEVADALIEDLSAHPWAGLPVTVTLHAEDSQGQRASAGPVSAVLPTRPFHEPMARAFLEERRALAWSLSNAAPVAQRLKAVTAYPEDYFEGLAGPYLAARSAIRRLDYARADGRVAAEAGSVMELLWQAALMLENGDLSTAAERLRRAQERLSEALERGADEQEVARLMDELRQAMSEYLQEMARQALQNLDQLDNQPPPDGREMTARDLQEMLEEIERMAQTDPETARQMLERLAQMLENMRMQAQRGGEGQQGEGGQAMEQLNDMLREQQELADRSFEELQRRQGQQGQPGRQGEGGQQGQQGEGGQPGQQGRQGGRQPGGMGGDAEQQEALRQLLDQLRQGLPGGGSAEAEQALREADRAMGGARDSLEGDDPGAALDDQVQAMESLRQGARELGEAMRRQAGQGQGDRAGRGDPDAAAEGRDPLGRPTSNRGALEGSDTSVPGEDAVKRARELLEEIRRRSGDRNRPQLELDYLRRLLDQF